MLSKIFFLRIILIMLFIASCASPPKKMLLTKDFVLKPIEFEIKRRSDYRKNPAIFFGDFEAFNNKQLLPKKYDNNFDKKGKIEITIETTVNEYVNSVVNKINNEQWEVVLLEEIYYYEKYEVTKTKKSTTKDALKSNYREVYRIFAKNKKSEKRSFNAIVKWSKSLSEKTFFGSISLPNGITIQIVPNYYRDYLSKKLPLYTSFFTGYYFKINNRVVGGLDLRADRFIVKKDLKEEIITPLSIISAALFFEENLNFWPNVEKQIRKDYLEPY